MAGIDGERRLRPAPRRSRGPRGPAALIGAAIVHLQTKHAAVLKNLLARDIAILGAVGGLFEALEEVMTAYEVIRDERLLISSIAMQRGVAIARMRERLTQLMQQRDTLESLARRASVMPQGPCVVPSRLY